MLTGATRGHLFDSHRPQSTRDRLLAPRYFREPSRSSLLATRYFLLLCFVSALHSRVQTRAATLVNIASSDFDAEGRLVRRISAAAGSADGSNSKLTDTVVELFRPEAPDLPVAFLRLEDAEYDRSTRIIRGEGRVVFETEEATLNGKGFEYDLAKGTVSVKQDVVFQSATANLLGDTAVAYLDLTHGRILQSIEVRGNVVAVRGPHGSPELPDRIETDSARFESASEKLFVKTPAHTWHGREMTELRIGSGTAEFPLGK